MTTAWSEIQDVSRSGSRGASSALTRAVPAVVVVGARQVGKRNLLRHLVEGQAELVVFDPVTDVENARAEPDLFHERRGTPLVLDEVQNAPELFPAPLRMLDEEGRERARGALRLTGESGRHRGKDLPAEFDGLLPR